MTQTITTDVDRTATTPCDPAMSTTKSLLGYGVIAGPLYVLAVGIQAFTRDGFDIGRHAASLLSNGDLGWIQISTFILTGLMSLAATIGMRRAITAGRGSTWGPRLVGLWGVGLIAAGCFFALIASCLIFARRYAAQGDRARAGYSAVTGVFFFAAFAGLASGSPSTAAVLAFWLAIVLAWVWLSTVSVDLYRTTH